MSRHLSQDQFAKCAAGRRSKADLEHINECPTCSAELERFRKTLSLFRTAIRHRVDDRIDRSALEIAVPRRLDARVSTWRWAMVAAAVVALVIPYFMSEYRKPQQVTEQAIFETNPEAVMERVSLHLSRTVPAPMEPLMSLLPSDQSTSESGGVQ